MALVKSEESPFIFHNLSLISSAFESTDLQSLERKKFPWVGTSNRNLRLERNLHLTFNKGHKMHCQQTRNGGLTIFNLSSQDVKVLNNLLIFLLYKFKVDSNTHFPNLLPMTEIIYITIDHFSKFLDASNEHVLRLPFVCFNAKVSVKIMGVQFKWNENVQQYEAKLIIHLDELVLDETEEELKYKNRNCIFMDNYY